MAEPDFSKLSDAELEAIVNSADAGMRLQAPAAPDMSKMTDAELEAIANGQTPVGKYTPNDINSLSANSWAGDPAAPGGTFKLMTQEPLQYAKKAISNVPESGFQLLKGLAETLRHPVQTASTLADTVYGGTVGKLANVPEEKTYDAFKAAIGNRYGGKDQLANTLMADPVGFLADLSTLAGGGGALLKGASAIPKLAPLATVGEALAKTGQVVDPINMLIKAGGAAAPKVGELAAQILGKTTGAGPEAIRKAFAGGEDFTDAMRGNTSATKIVNEARSAVEDLKQQRRDNYTQQLNQIAGSSEVLDLNPVLREWDNQRRKFNIRRDASGDLVFDHKTKLDRSAWGNFEEIDDLMKQWSADRTARSPLDFDTLKQRLDDYFTPNGNMQVALTSTRKAVKQQILDKVPEYANLTKSYQEASDLLDEINHTLSTNAQPDTLLRKLISTNREGFEMRRDLLNQFDNKAGSSLGSMAAGYQMQQALPKGLVAPLIGGGASAGFAYGHNPWASSLAGLLAASSSPRIVGEAANFAGKTSNIAGKVFSTIMTPGATTTRNLTLLPARLQYDKP